MDERSLEEFFAQAEDVLTNWPDVRDVDAADTADPGVYDLGDDGMPGWPSWVMLDVEFREFEADPSTPDVVVVFAGHPPSDAEVWSWLVGAARLIIP